MARLLPVYENSEEAWFAEGATKSEDGFINEKILS